jgi:hypothetical protein
MKTSLSRKKRSRSYPTPSGKRTTITDNDIFGIFEPLSRHAQLTTKQLVAFDRRYASKTRNRLTDLYHEQGSWLERLNERVKFANYLFSDEMYRLGEDAEYLLKARGVIPSHEWVQASRIGAHSVMPSRVIRLSHDHFVSDIAIDIEIGARAVPDIQFLNHIEIIKAAPEIKRKHANPFRVPVPVISDAPRFIEPDAMFGLGNRYFAIEADMGTESIETIIKGKIRAYREIVGGCIIDDHFGIDNLTVLFVTINETRMRNMMKAVSEIARNKRSVMFAFACRPDLSDFMRAPAPTGRMFREPWKRVGFDDLQLNSLPTHKT